MDVITFPTPGLGDQSYLLTHEGQGILVDPQRDIDRFLRAAEERGVEPRFVLETHLHNDYVSGAEQAALRSGAELVLPAASGAAYRHTPAFHLEDIHGGGLTIRPVHTPGHTPEHTSYLILLDGEMTAVFTGGSLLIGAAGRTDLLGPERARSLARLQHGSLRRLARLPREVEVFPTHGAGSFCTSGGAGRTTSTIGAERDRNPLLWIDDADDFADRLLAAPKPIPAFYPFMGPANTLGVPPMPPVRVPELDEPAEGTHVVDIRPRRAQARGMLPGSLGISLDEDFGSWAGWLIPYGEPITLVAEPGQDVDEAVTQLARIGVDEVAGVVRHPGDAATQTYELLGLRDFARRVSEPGAQVLDVRMRDERESARLENAVGLHLPDVFTEDVPFDRSEPVYVACASGRRAAIAASELARRGYSAIALDGAGIPDVIAELRTSHAA
ncbi:MAG TPA: MBL fold metallo-hydrolase [Nonomuraea sp.]|uniref:MBL fold metallo-hydrolase n=1 Tax=Nonomuraea sp. NPDC049649 TaxID=3155776 RepID=UPI002CAFFBDC|nr:MBL fold metallo-hydrolase [Nonomuraea sp.]